MSLRPRSAHWFELLVAQADLDAVLAQLGASGLVQLEGQGIPVPGAATQLARGLDEFVELTRRYAPWWPDADAAPGASTATPPERMQRALRSLRAWALQMGPRIAALEALLAEQRDLGLLRAFLEGCRTQGSPRLDWLARPGASLDAQLHLLAEAVAPVDLPAGVMLHRVESTAGRFVLAVGERAAVARFADGLRATRAIPVTMPAWLPATPAS